MTRLTLHVVAIDDAVPGIRTLTLARADGAALPSFTPGSHVVIEYAGGGQRLFTDRGECYAERIRGVGAGMPCRPRWLAMDSP